MYHDDREEIVRLPAPEIAEKELVGFNTGIRPYRKGGIRLDITGVGMKSIFHNYGHGGGGVSLCFGSCKQSLEKYDFYTSSTEQKPKTVTVLGSG